MKCGERQKDYKVRRWMRARERGQQGQQDGETRGEEIGWGLMMERLHGTCRQDEWYGKEEKDEMIVWRSVGRKCSNQDEDRWKDGIKGGRWQQEKAKQQSREHTRSEKAKFRWYHTLLATLITRLCGRASAAPPLTQIHCFPLVRCWIYFSHFIMFISYNQIFGGKCLINIQF